jgi:hypothetical protein
VAGGCRQFGAVSTGMTMNPLINILTKSGLLTKDLDYHLVRASMVIIFLFNGHLILGYTLFSASGASWFLGVSEWLFGVLLLLGSGIKN